MKSVRKGQADRTSLLSDEAATFPPESYDSAPNDEFVISRAASGLKDDFSHLSNGPVRILRTP